MEDKIGKFPYISGPMSGIEDYNYNEFNKAEKFLYSFTNVFPINPHLLTYTMLKDRGFNITDFEMISYDEYLEYDINTIKEKATSLILIDGWNKSNGSRLELKAAQDKGIPIFELKNEKIEPLNTSVHIKSNSGKPRWGKFPFKLAEGILRVLEHGAKKYDWDNWKNAKTEDGIAEYTDALMRHAIAMADGEIYDKDSGEMHVDCIGANVLFLVHFFKEKIKEENKGRNNEKKNFVQE